MKLEAIGRKLIRPLTALLFTFSGISGCKTAPPVQDLNVNIGASNTVKEAPKAKVWAFKYIDVPVEPVEGLSATSKEQALHCLAEVSVFDEDTVQCNLIPAPEGGNMNPDWMEANANNRKLVKDPDFVTELDYEGDVPEKLLLPEGAVRYSSHMFCRELVRGKLKGCVKVMGIETRPKEPEQDMI